MLRLIGGHVGPVLRTGPPVDSAAEAIEWDEDIQDAAARVRRTGRFTREPESAPPPKRDVLKH